MRQGKSAGLLRGRVGSFLEDRFFVGSGCWQGVRRRRGLSCSGSVHYGSAALRIRLLEQRLSSCLGAASIVVGLLGFAVFVDGALALPEDVENLSKVDVAPNLGPLFRRLGDVLQALAE